MNTKLILIFWLLSTSLSGSAPSSPYHFRGLDITKLLPFSAKESSEFKRQHVEWVEQKYGTKYSTFHYLNTDGLVTKSETVTFKRGKKVVDIVQIYNYNSRGQLVLTYRTGDCHENRDSLAYDDQGRLIYYYSFGFYNEPKNKKTKYIDHNIKLSSVQGDFQVLIDSADYNFSGDTTFASSVTTYWLNKNNETVKIHFPNYTDTIVYETRGNTRLKKYMFKEEFLTKKDSAFKLGMLDTFVNELLISEAIYEMHSDGKIPVRKQFFIYDSIGHLVRSEYQNKYAEKNFYTYNYNGFLWEVVRLSAGESVLPSYEYKFTDQQ